MMEKKLSTREEQAIDWLKNEIQKDQTELDKEKQRFIESLKDFKKEEIAKPKEKLTLWKKIKKVQNNFRKIDRGHKKFSIDMSGVEHVFIHEDSVMFPVEEPKKEERPKQTQSTLKRFLSRFVSRGSSVK